MILHVDRTTLRWQFCDVQAKKNRLVKVKVTPESTLRLDPWLPFVLMTPVLLWQPSV